jgi:hypothetical protein
MLKDIKEHGARLTVQKLTTGKRPRQWEALLQKIETGDPRWLAVARELADGTDAGTSEDLQVVLARALPKNPADVLRLADTQSFLSINDLCAAPFIEPEPAYLKRYLRETRRSLRILHDAAVEDRRKKCLARIEMVISEESSRSLPQQEQRGSTVQRR